MRILITGSEGNIGRRLVPYLRSVGHEVFCFDLKQGYGDHYLTGNICTSGELHNAFEKFKPDVVYHMAAMVSRITCEASPAYTAEVNLAGTQNIIQLCLQYNAKMIYFSTSEVYGNQTGELNEDMECNPNNFYALTKYLGEKLVEYALTKGLKAVTVRPFMFYDEYEDMGVHRSAMIRFVESLIRGENITVHYGSMRSWMHIDDAVKALEKVMYFNAYEVINIGHPDCVPVYDLALMICEELGCSPSLITLNELPERMTLQKMPNLWKQTELLGIEPEINLKQGIKRVINVVKAKIAPCQSVDGGDLPTPGNWIFTSDCTGKCGCKGS